MKDIRSSAFMLSGQAVVWARIKTEKPKKGAC